MSRPGSVASLWEIAIKKQTGKFDPPDDLPDIAVEQGFELLPVEPRHAWAVRNLPIDRHRDPFDRLLVAQARVETMPIISAQPQLDQYAPGSGERARALPSACDDGRMTRVPRRRSPRSMASVMEGVLADIAPTDPLARLQTQWAALAGERYGAISRPVRLRKDGTIVISCDSGMAAADLQMHAPDLTALIEEHLGLRCTLRFEGPRRG
jgi:Dna[CI] antecedent, DciA